MRGSAAPPWAVAHACARLRALHAAGEGKTGRAVPGERRVLRILPASGDLGKDGAPENAQCCVTGRGRGRVASAQCDRRARPIGARGWARGRAFVPSHPEPRNCWLGSACVGPRGLGAAPLSRGAWAGSPLPLERSLRVHAL